MNNALDKFLGDLDNYHAMREDAERYRWLEKNGFWDADYIPRFAIQFKTTIDHKTLSGYIDAVRKTS